MNIICREYSRIYSNIRIFALCEPGGGAWTEYQTETPHCPYKCHIGVVFLRKQITAHDIGISRTNQIQQLPVACETKNLTSFNITPYIPIS